MLKSTLFFLGVTLGTVLLVSCERSTRELPMVESDQTIAIERFELAFANPNNSLNELKATYPYLFPVQTPDSIWIAKRKDSLENLLIQAVDSVFGDFNKPQKEINQLFSYYHFYFPNARIPKGISLTTNIDYFSRVIYADSLLLMGLDNFLGDQHPFYQNIPMFLRTTMTPDHLTHSIAEQLALAQLPKNNQTTFLSKIIWEGKLIYLQERLTPKRSMEMRMGYTKEQLEWAQLNESEIWRYFIDQKLLYSTDKELEYRFINHAPFSKFKLALDQESPGRIGRFIGYQIVKSYMNHNSVSLELLLKEEAVTLLKKAKYKPKKS